MKSAFEHWPDFHRGDGKAVPLPSEGAAVAGSKAAGGAAESGAQKQLESLADALKALEQSLSFNLEEVLGNYRPGPKEVEPASFVHADVEEPDDTSGPASAGFDAEAPAQEVAQEALARRVADHVIGCLREMQTPLHTELTRMQGMVDEYYRDNRVLSGQVRQLLDERERMLKAVGAYEIELTRFRQLLGNLYLRL